MKILIDMNLSPLWVPCLREEGWAVVHWSAVGDIRAPDHQIASWANENGYIVLTHDLDFGTMLAMTQARGPSVVQIRAHDIMPEQLASRLIAALHELEPVLHEGALVIVDAIRVRVRILPLQR